MPDLIAGIDLGTSTSAIGYFVEIKGRRHGHVQLVPGGLGLNWFPSAVLFDASSGQWIVGNAAQAAAKMPGRAPYYVLSAKRHLGIDRVIPLSGSSTIVVDGTAVEVTPQLLLSKILLHLKHQTEARSPEFHLNRVVVAIPMVYMSHEASLTREAVELAGMELLDFIQEPTAAALYYVHDNADMNNLREGEKILVFDLGGGTFDITVFQLASRTGNELVLDVLTTDGVRRLGGDDATDLILNDLRSKGLSLPDPVPADLKHVLVETIERDVKVPLSNADDPRSAFSYVNINHRDVHFGREITFAEFKALLDGSDLKQRLTEVCARVKRNVGDVDRVMMVGGSSHVPICKEILRELFGDRININAALNVQEAVVRGAVYRAAQLNGRSTGRRKVTLRNHGVLSHDFGLLVGSGDSERFRVLIPKGTPYPMEAPAERRFPIAADPGQEDSPLVIECAQGEADEPFRRGASGHKIFASVPHGRIPVGCTITVRFQANDFGEIVFSSDWGGGRMEPKPLRPSFAS